MIGERGGLEAFAQRSLNTGEGFAGDEAPGLSQTSEAPDGPSKLMRARPSKLMRIKEKIFRRCLSRDSQCLLSARRWRGVGADQTGSRPNPAKPHVEESLQSRVI